MKSGIKLKLLRALTGLTQQEMADLMGVSRSFAISLEDRDKKLPIQRARRLADILNIEAGWLIDNRYNFINGPRFAVFCFDGNKAMGSTAATQKRCINASAKFLTRYLPELFNSANVTYLSICRVNSGNVMYFIVFNNQGLLLKITDSDVMADAINSVVGALKVSAVRDIACGLDFFGSVTYSAVGKLKEFIDHQELSVTEKHNFKKTIEERPAILAYIASQTANGSKSLEEATKDYKLMQQAARVKRVSRDIVKYDISLAEIKKVLIAGGRHDLV